MVKKKKPSVTSKQIKIIYAVYPDGDTARAAAHLIISQRLAACVNIIPGIQAIYDWEEERFEASQVLMLIKTDSAREPKIYRWLEKNHPHSTPALLTLSPSKVAEKFQAWILGG